MKINIWKIKKYRKVRDDCHYTREYRGVAQSLCNLKIVSLKKCRYPIYEFIDMQKLITNTWKIMVKIKNCHIFNIWM